MLALAIVVHFVKGRWDDPIDACSSMLYYC